jgi:hypothetical protein
VYCAVIVVVCLPGSKARSDECVVPYYGDYGSYHRLILSYDSIIGAWKMFFSLWLAVSWLCRSTLAAQSRPCERSRGPGWDKWRFPTTISGWTGQLHRQGYLWQGPEVSMISRQTSWIDVLMIRMSSTKCRLPKCSATVHHGSLARAAMLRLDLSCAALFRLPS